MVIPTDEGWAAAYNKLKPYYKYSTSYEDKTKGTQGTTLVYRSECRLSGRDEHQHGYRYSSGVQCAQDW